MRIVRNQECFWARASPPQTSGWILEFFLRGLALALPDMFGRASQSLKRVMGAATRTKGLNAAPAT